MYYLIKDELVPSNEKEALSSEYPRVICLSGGEAKQKKKDFPSIERLEGEEDIYITRADVSYHYLRGSFSIPDHADLNKDDRAFLFVMDDEGIIFIDDSGYVEEAIGYIRETKKWYDPGMERFLYDLLDYIVKDDLKIMENYEHELEHMEDNADKNTQEDLARLNKIRSEIRRFYVHYEELLFLIQEFSENENGFFRQDRLNLFHTCANRIERLLNTASFLRDYVVQIDDMYRELIAFKQNNITTLLTVITTIFAPLTLITGWYGMNFKYMPELNVYYAYPVVFAVSLLIAVLLLWYFRRKKWL